MECIGKFLQLERIGNEFYKRNAVGKGFTRVMHWNVFLHLERIGKGFTRGMHWKRFYKRNVLKRVLQE